MNASRTESGPTACRQVLVTFNLLVLVAGVCAALTLGTMLRSLESRPAVDRQQIQRDIDVQRQVIERERQTQLASIERWIDDSSFTYFDVTSFIADTAQGQKLGADLEYLPGLGCYVRKLDRADWKRETLDESELLRRILGTRAAKKPPKTYGGEPGKTSPVYVWSGPDEIVVASNQNRFPTVRLFPFVSIQSFSNDRLATLIGNATAKPRQDRLEGMKRTESLLELLAKTAPKATPPSDTSETKKPTESGKLAALRELERLFRSDLACFLLASNLRQLYEFSRSTGNATVHLKQVDKKGNLLYLHAVISINDADAKRSVYWDREMFFVTLPDRSFLITASAPSQNRVPECADWITAWLAGIKVASSTSGNPLVSQPTLGVHPAGDAIASIARHIADEPQINQPPKPAP